LMVDGLLFASFRLRQSDSQLKPPPPSIPRTQTSPYTRIELISPAIGSNFWIWLSSHDINWWVALATLGYIGLQSYYLIKNKGRRGLE
ncbi:hypothetical protein QZN00_30420, partial [Burkholderia multivorans]|nr:hypothetical protein [Burkholderia multivorans]